MGYRSDVKYVLLFKTKEKLTNALALAALEFSDIGGGDDILQNMQVTDSEVHNYDTYPYHISVHYENVKWYESTAWVSAQIRFMESFSSSEEQYVFMRLGEEGDDIDIASSDEVYISDYIEFNRRSEFI